MSHYRKNGREARPADKDVSQLIDGQQRVKARQKRRAGLLLSGRDLSA